MSYTSKYEFELGNDVFFAFRSEDEAVQSPQDETPPVRSTRGRSFFGGALVVCCDVSVEWAIGFGVAMFFLSTFPRFAGFSVFLASVIVFGGWLLVLSTSATGFT
jgi:hypothetical protein